MRSMLKVVLIGGFGRSGSTLLERVLGQDQRFFSVGELRHIWDRGILQNQLCSCGNRFHDCDFWREVILTAFGELSDSDQLEIFNLQRQVDRVRNIPRMVWGKTESDGYGSDLRKYRDIVLSLFEAVKKVSGCEYIVDSSKDPSHGYLLSTSYMEMELRTLHLVRDSRAVAFSWKRKKLRPEIHWRKEYMPQYSIVKSATNWSIANLLMLGLSRRSTLSTVLRYEDLVTQPDQAIRNIYDELQLGERHVEEESSSSQKNNNHTVSGNPIRFQHGPISIRSDDEWKKEMVLWDRALTTSITWPLLLKYGYSLRLGA